MLIEVEKVLIKDTYIHGVGLQASNENLCIYLNRLNGTEGWREVLSISEVQKLVFSPVSLSNTQLNYRKKNDTENNLSLA